MTRAEQQRAVEALAEGGRLSGEATVDQPSAVAVDERHVYFVDARRGSVGRVARDKPGPVDEVARGVAFPASGTQVLAVDDGSVWFVGTLTELKRIGKSKKKRAQTKAGVFRVEKGGGKVVEVAVARAGASDLALSADTVYWLDREEGEASAATPATIMAAPKEGGGAREVLKLGPACALAVDGTTLFWLELGDKPTVRKASLEGEGAATVAPAMGAACSLAVDARSVAWPRPSLDQVLIANRSGGGARVLAMVPGRPNAVLRRGGDLLVATEAWPDGRPRAAVYRIEPAGGEPVPVARGGRLGGFTFDGKSLFWSEFDEGNGALMGAPVPGR